MMKAMYKYPALLVIVIFVSLASADTVYTVSGKTYSGEVVVSGEEVIVKTETGEVTLQKSNVVHIARDKPPAAAEDKLEKIEIPSALSTQPGAEKTTVALAIKSAQMDSSQFTMPQCFVFLYMRNLAAVDKVESSTINFRKQLDYWKTQTQSRKRRAGINWIMPRDFIRRRDKYTEFIGEAEILAKKSRYYDSNSIFTTNSPSRSKKTTPAHKRYAKAAKDKFQQAAKVWADPLGQHFLTALSDIRSGDYQKAVKLLDRCIKTAPRIAAFYQARALAYGRQKQYEKALPDWIEVLKLKPDSLDSVRNLRGVLSSYRADKIDTDIYKLARNISEEYPTIRRTRRSRRGTRGIQWLMPGKKTWTSTTSSMPEPPYDRLYFNQAVAVVVAPSVLLVDRQTVEDALDIYVQVDEKTLARAVITGRLSMKMDFDTPEVALLKVEGYTFESVVQINADPDPTQCRLITTNCYEQMGSEITTTEGKLTELKTIAGQSGGPVVDKDFRLIGFIGPKTDPTHETAGPHTYWSVTQLEKILKSAKRSSEKKIPTNYKTIKYDKPEKKTSAKTFLVYATKAERFD